MKKSAPKSKVSKLSPRQELFCQEYVVDLNGKAAAIRAGYKPSRAKTEASELLTNPLVKAEIERLQSKTAAKLEITVEGIAKEYMQIVQANIVDFLDADGGITNLKKLPREITAAIESIKVSEYFDKKEQRMVRVIHFKLHNKNHALEALGKHLGFFEKDNKQKSDLTLNGFSWDEFMKSRKENT